MFFTRGCPHGTSCFLTSKEVNPLQEDIENKSVTLIINSSKLTARTLATVFTKFLHYTHNKAREHRDVKPQGKQTVKELIAQNQGVEKTELADKDEVKAFNRIAKQYGVDYAIRKGYSEDGKQRYILFFKGRDRSAIDQAMSAYTEAFAKKHRRKHRSADLVYDPFEGISPVPQMPIPQREHTRSRGLER